MRMSFLLTNSSMPNLPSSRPKPDRFTPPNGSSAPSAPTALTNTMPASIRSATRVRLLLVGGEDVGTQPERGVVGHFDGLLFGGHLVDGGDRTEQFLPIGGESGETFVSTPGGK